jgi:hypothetical protein
MIISLMNAANVGGGWSGAKAAFQSSLRKSSIQ